MLFMVDIALWGFIPLVMYLFSSMEKRQAMLTCALVGVLFLPIYSYKTTGLPPYDKVTAVNMVVMLAAVIFDWARVSKLRIKWFDLPIILYSICPMFSSLANDLGVYDGFSMILNQLPMWLPCYFLGRIYCNDLPGLRALSLTYFIGGLIYVPFCLYEVRMSPQFHNMVYGYHQHNVMQQMRYDGFRPMVFMQHGLAVGIWMACASLTGFVLWRTKAVKQIMNIPVGWFVGALLVTTFLCKSTGALVILSAAIAAFLILQFGRLRIIMLVLILVPPAYMTLRLTNTLSRETITTWMYSNVNEERTGSLDARLMQEDVFSEHAMERPIFGWGGWGRSWPKDENGDNLTRGLDSLWVMTLGENGFVGLSLLTLSLLFPAILMLWRASWKVWNHPAAAPATAMAIVLVMYMIDNLFNAMLNPLLMISAGGVTGWIMQTAPAPEALAAPRTPAARGAGKSAPRGALPGYAATPHTQR